MMTDELKRIAELCGYDVKLYKPSNNLWLYENGQPLMPLGSFMPHISANQAIKCLSRLEHPWDWHSESGFDDDGCRVVIFGGIGIGETEGRSSDPDPVKAFCAAAMAAILESDR